MLSENNFKMYLIEEIKSKTFAYYKDIYDEVESFSKTKSFSIAYNKWKKINLLKHKQGPVLMKHVLNGIR